MKIGNRLYRLNQPLKIWFEPRDIWVGVYWKHKDIRGEMSVTDIYICLLPMLPLLISVVAWRKSAQHKMHQTGLTAAQKDAFDKTVKDYMAGDVKESPRW